MNELFFIGLYLLCFSSDTSVPSATDPAPFPKSIEKGTTGPTEPWMLFSSHFSAAAMEVARANKIDYTIPWLLTCACAPVMLFKQWVNVEQLMKASQWLAEGDRIERKRAKAAAKRR